MRTQTFSIKNEPADSGYLVAIENHIKKIYEVGEYAIVGRDPAAQIQFNDEFMSTRHLRIEKREDGFYAKDLRSLNGTYINGCRILEAKLQNKDRIHIGSIEFAFMHKDESEDSYPMLQSKNPDWASKLQKIPAMARSTHPVLITGPSGVGKEVMASCIHRLSPRSSSVFLSINCSALTENLAESELFGHRKGSFTGANDDRKGAFESARGGTLFLDEIGDLPLAIQPKLLRALENNEIKPVGSDKTQTIDVRIVAATNKNLPQLIQAGLFREDLYYRLQILQLQPPALKDRMEDFDTLVSNLAKQQRVHFTNAAIHKMREYSWPGNIRELKNLISRASAIYSPRPVGDKDIIELLDLRTEKEVQENFKPTFITKQMMKEYEKEAILERLAHYSGNQRRVASDLGIAKSTLHDRIKNYGIDLSLFKKKLTDAL